MTSQNDRDAADDLDVRPGCAEAMGALFALHDAIDEHDLTVADLAKVCRLAVESGHDLLVVSMYMMTKAVGIAKAEQDADSPAAEPGHQNVTGDGSEG